MCPVIIGLCLIHEIIGYVFFLPFMFFSTFPIVKVFLK